MAINPSVRVTGLVVSVDQLSGTSAATGKDYSFRVARVLVGQAGLCDVVLSDGVESAPGELVDWLVEATAYEGNPRFRVQALYRD